MAINKNHEFEDLDGVKCAVVEKNVSPARVDFIKSILEYNRYTVVVVKSPPPKVVPAKPVAAPAEGEAPPAAPEPAAPPAPETFTVGVTDVTFNVTNAIFGRLLRTAAGTVVTLAFWNQVDRESNDEIPYYEKK